MRNGHHGTRPCPPEPRGGRGRWDRSHSKYDGKRQRQSVARGRGREGVHRVAPDGQSWPCVSRGGRLPSANRQSPFQKVGWRVGRKGLWLEGNDIMMEKHVHVCERGERGRAGAGEARSSYPQRGIPRRQDHPAAQGAKSVQDGDGKALGVEDTDFGSLF